MQCTASRTFRSDWIWV